MAVKAASASFCCWSSVVFAGSAVGFGFGFGCGVGLSMVLGCVFVRILVGLYVMIFGEMIQR